MRLHLTTALWCALLSLLVTQCTAQCSKPVNTLTSDCGNQCDTKDKELCVFYNAKADDNACYKNSKAIKLNNDTRCIEDDDDANCDLECLNSAPFDLGDKIAFILLVPFGDYQTAVDEERSGEDWWKDAQDNLRDDRMIVPFVSNNYLTTIGSISVGDDVTQVQIQGGTQVGTNYLKGKAVQLQFQQNFLVDSPHVESLALVDIDFSSNLPDFSSLTTSIIKQINIENALLPEVPASVLGLKNLEELYLPFNQIQTFPKEFSMKGIFKMSLVSNNLTSFEASPPNLQDLQLTNNSLKSIPPSIASLRYLNRLDISGNPLSDFNVSNALYNVITNLSYFNYDPVTVTPPCDYDLQRALTLKLCVIPDDEDQVAAASGSQDTTSGMSPSTKTILYIVIPIACVMVVLAVVGFCLWRRRQKMAANNGETFDGPTNTLETNEQGSAQYYRAAQLAHGKYSLWTDDELLALQIPYEDITDVRRIGGGGFGEVYLVSYRGTNYLASKRIPKDKKSLVAAKKLATEIKLAAALDHPKIVALVGATWMREMDIQGLFEYMDGGDLHTYLRTDTTTRKWTRAKLQMAIDIADALVYTHSFDPPLVHRDLKSRNVLLTVNHEAKVSDFGAARYNSFHGTMSGGVGTMRWLAPEVVAGSNTYDQSCDIYSFGAVLAELDSHDLPYADVCSENGKKMADVALLNRIASGEVSPTFTRECPPKIKEVALMCLEYNKMMRPTAAQVTYALRTILKNEDYETVE